MAAIIGDYLSDNGMAWDTSSCGDGGLERLGRAASEGKPYDVVIIDANLTAIDGLSFAKRIRAEDEIAAMPILLLTPIAYPLQVGRISRIGRIRCVNKPVMPRDLQRNLSRLLDKDDSLVVQDVRDPDAEVSRETGDLRILIAEDNSLNRQLLQNMLASLNYQVDAVADGPSVLQALADKPYDLVLMDCQMPGLNGDAVTRRVRSEPQRFRTQPVIVAITADVSARHETKCRLAGMDDFLAKPIRRRQLVDGLRRWQKDLAMVRLQRMDAAATPGPEQEVWAQLRNRGDENGDFLRGYIDLFLDDTDTRLRRIDVAVTKEDWEVVRRESHALKGACLEMGAAEMCKQCSRVHEATANGATSSTPDALHDLRTAFERIRPVYEAARSHLA